jgi:hypothetical protein
VNTFLGESPEGKILTEKLKKDFVILNKIIYHIKDMVQMAGPY